LKRVPAQFFRAVGVLSILAGVFAFFCVWIVSLFPGPSTGSLVLVGIVTPFFALSIGAAVLKVLLIGERYQLFRWHKP